MKDANLSRRDTIKIGLAGTAAAAMAGSATETQAADTKPDVWVFNGKDKTKLMQECMKIIAANGGFGKDSKKLALKVNVSWARTPEQGANTHPELVAEFLKGCKAAGIEEVVIPEYSCDPPDKSFKMSGILDAAEKHGAKMIDLRKNGKFKDEKIPGGKKLKEAPVSTEFIDADVVVNMPVAKHHGSMTLTCAMKNWMGIVKTRRKWHKIDLAQCIADFSTFIKPAWTIVDATRVMITKGPKGPGQLKIPNLVILSKDPVAADACASQLVGKTPGEIKYLKLAKEMKIGVIDKAQMNIHRQVVS